MNGKKIVGILLVATLLVALSPAPAAAGVGGCRATATCGSTQSFHGTVVRGRDARGPADIVFDSLKWVFPSRVTAYLRGLVEIGTGRGPARIQGVGGCRLNCGL